MKLLLLADKHVGQACGDWLLRQYPQDLAALVCVEENALASRARAAGIPCFTFHSSEQLVAEITAQGIAPDLGIMAWWPTIIKPALIGFPRLGFLNTHPSFLPYNRGKHYNFWALVEQAPFGVSLHFVDAGIDSGAVVAQRRIEYGWEDTGGSLHAKGLAAMIELFQESYPRLRTLDIPAQPQDPQAGSFHFGRELTAASKVELDRSYRARDLLNLLRARTFSGHPACWFSDQGKEYEVRVEIKPKNP